MGGMKNNREKSQLQRTWGVSISTVFGLHWDEPYSQLAEGNLRAILAQRQVKSLFLFTLQIRGGYCSRQNSQVTILEKTHCSLHSLPYIFTFYTLLFCFLPPVFSTHI